MNRNFPWAEILFGILSGYKSMRGICVLIDLGGKHIMSSRVFKLVLFAFVLLVLEIPQVAAQTCRWDGTGPSCAGECGEDETEVTRAASSNAAVQRLESTNPFGSNCTIFGTKAYCCKTTNRTCRWDGTAPFCDGECTGDWKPAEPPAGSSSGMACWTGSKAYCCRTKIVSLPMHLRNLPDTDKDNVPDEYDNCPEAANPDQIDSNKDGIGDKCTPLPQAPIGCSTSNEAICGLLSIRCKAPLPISNEIVIQDLMSNIGFKVLRIVDDIGLIDASYFREGDSLIRVCTRNDGGISCSNEVSVKLGQMVCPAAPPHPRPCPQGEVQCPGQGGRCMPSNECNLPQ